MGVFSNLDIDSDYRKDYKSKPKKKKSETEVKQKMISFICIYGNHLDKKSLDKLSMAEIRVIYEKLKKERDKIVEEAFIKHFDKKRRAYDTDYYDKEESIAR